MDCKYYKVECFGRRNGRHVDYPYSTIVRSYSKGSAINSALIDFASKSDDIISQDDSYLKALSLVKLECLYADSFWNGRWDWFNRYGRLKTGWYYPDGKHQNGEKKYYYKATICKHYKDDD